MRISDWSSDVCSSDLPQRQQEYALDKGDPRTRHSGPAKGDEPCQRDRSVTDEIERVGLERLAVGDKPADDLACAEAEIEQHDNPKRTPVGWVLFRPRAISSAAAAACFIRICHVLLLQPPVTVEASISANGSRYMLSGTLKWNRLIAPVSVGITRRGATGAPTRSARMASIAPSALDRKSTRLNSS